VDCLSMRHVGAVTCSPPQKPKIGGGVIGKGHVLSSSNQVLGNRAASEYVEAPTITGRSVCVLPVPPSEKRHHFRPTPAIAEMRLAKIPIVCLMSGKQFSRILPMAVRSNRASSTLPPTSLSAHSFLASARSPYLLGRSNWLKEFLTSSMSYLAMI
jgi:hypothetical protein